MAFYPVQAQDFALYGAGVSATATSLILTSMLKIDGSAFTMATDFGAVGYGVSEPDTALEENFSFTGLTNNANGTTTLTGVTRGLRFNTPYTQDTALRQPHSGGTIIRLSNTGPFYNEFVTKRNDETIDGIKTFSASPVVPTPTTDMQASTKKYADDLAIAGAPDASTIVKGILEAATDAELQAGTATGATGALLAATGASFTQTPTANKVPVASSAGKLPAGWGGSASTLATLNGSSKVVEDPANATTTPTASKIPIAGAGGELADGWQTYYKLFVGDASDGSITFDGAATVLGLAPVANVYTLTRDIFLSSGTVSVGASIITSSYRIFCSGTFTVNGTVKHNGNNASGVTGGAALAAGSISGATAGDNGGAGGAAQSSNAPGNPGATATSTSITNAIGSVSSAGGTAAAGGSGQAGAGGAAGTMALGTVTAPKTNYHVPTIAITLHAIDGTSIGYIKGSAPAAGGAGGGGGAGSSGTPGGGAGGQGGGGGGTGGIIAIFAGAIVIGATGVIQANGGNGGNGANGQNASGTNSGGGGVGGGGAGGTGGVIILMYHSLTNGGTIQASGGSGGSAGTVGGTPTGTGAAGATNGTAGATGTAGQIIQLTI